MYQIPEMNVLKIDVEDIITTSDIDLGGGNENCENETEEFG